MTVDEIIDFYREQGRDALAACWEGLRGAVPQGAVEVANFDPFVWTIRHDKVTAPAGRRPPLVAWCHAHAEGRWMFNALATGDLYLFERPEDAEAFRAQVRVEAAGAR
jgi:hypothetical protein